jgi:hypothetical protein
MLYRQKFDTFIRRYEDVGYIGRKSYRRPNDRPPHPYREWYERYYTANEVFEAVFAAQALPYAGFKIHPRANPWDL